MSWKKLDYETIKAYQAFCVFVVLCPKSLRNLAKVLGARLSTLTTWFRKYDWEKRKADFLNDILQKTPESMHLRHMTEAIALQQKALEKFNSIEPENLSNSEVIRFLTAGANLERAARRAYDEKRPKDLDEKEETIFPEDFLQVE